MARADRGRGLIVFVLLVVVSIVLTTVIGPALPSTEERDQISDGHGHRHLEGGKLPSPIDPPGEAETDHEEVETVETEIRSEALVVTDGARLDLDLQCDRTVDEGLMA